MLGLEALNRSFRDNTKVDFKPSDVQMVHYFFLDLGVDLNGFCSLPLPYIFGMVATNSYIDKKSKEKRS